MTTSSKLRLSQRRRTYVRLIGEIHHALNQALTEEHAKRGLTRTQIAEILGKDKSFVTRKLGGTSNMTLETLADLAFAMNRPVKLAMPSSSYAAGGNHRPPEQPTTSSPPQPMKEGKGTLVALAT